MKISVEKLKDLGACRSGLNWFRRTVGAEVWEGEWTEAHQWWTLASEGRLYLGWAWGIGLIPAWSLAGANLTDADLRRANLYGADLRRADLRRANLFDADLCGADLRRANLTDARLCGADLANANLANANLTGADLTGADLCGADLRRANLGAWGRGPDGYAQRRQR